MFDNCPTLDDTDTSITTQRKTKEKNMSDWWTYNAEQERMDDFGDGYRNEFQRAHAWSSMNADRGDHAKANALVAAGRFVVVGFYPIFCKVTDGHIGECLTVRFDAATRAEAEAFLAASPRSEFDDEGRTEVWPLVPYVAPAPAPTDDNDDIPF